MPVTELIPFSGAPAATTGASNQERPGRVPSCHMRCRFSATGSRAESSGTRPGAANAAANLPSPAVNRMLQMRFTAAGQMRFSAADLAPGWRYLIWAELRSRIHMPTLASGEDRGPHGSARTRTHARPAP